jgi:hypothetical protein
MMSDNVTKLSKNRILLSILSKLKCFKNFKFQLCLRGHGFHRAWSTVT